MRQTSRIIRHGLARGAALACVLGASSCAEPFRGSWVEFVLGETTQTPGDTPDAVGGRPPSGTHYEFWVSTGGRAYFLRSFAVARQVDPTFPCFIELDDSKFPGLHTTKWYEKNLEDVLKHDSSAKECGAGQETDTAPCGDDEIGQVADAFAREERMNRVAGALKAVGSVDVDMRPEMLTALAAKVASEAPIEATDEASNAKRLAICTAFFKEHPLYYVGGDKVFALPLNGEFYGMVEGIDPRNSAPIGGAGFTVPVTFENFDYLWINWQFDNPQDPRISNYGPSSYGYHYMSGAPENRTRRTVNVRMQNERFLGIRGDVAVFPGIDKDNVQF